MTAAPVPFHHYQTLLFNRC